MYVHVAGMLKFTLVLFLTIAVDCLANKTVYFHTDVS